MLNNMVRFTAYENSSLTKIRKFLNETDTDTVSDDYINVLEESVCRHEEESYIPSSSIVCYSLSDNYDQVYHSPVFNLSRHILTQEKDWFEGEPVGDGTMDKILAGLYEKHYCGSQKAILNNFLLEELSITYIKMFDNSEKNNFSQQLFNPGLVSISSNYVIYECPPTLKLIEYYKTNRESISESIQSNTEKIPLPWQVYVAVHDGKYNLIDTFMYFSKDSILKNGFDQSVFVPFLPNFYHNGLLCRPFYANYEDVSRYSKNVSGVINASYDAVWNSGWNFDLYDTLLENVNNFLKKVHKSDFKNNLESKNLGHICDSMIQSFIKSPSPLSRFSYLLQYISQLMPEDMLFFPYANPSSQQLAHMEREDWINYQYEVFMNNLDITDEEREDSSYVDELFQEHLSSLEFDEKEKSFKLILETSVANHCKSYHSLMAMDKDKSYANSANEDTYSRLALYFQKNFSPK